MKIRQLIVTIVIISFTVLFVIVGLAGSQSQTDTENIIIEKVIPSKAIEHSLKSGDQFKPDKSIYSKNTIISLIVAIFGIIAFRRNTYS
jgi:hypothetical protein